MHSVLFLRKKFCAAVIACFVTAAFFSFISFASAAAATDVWRLDGDGYAMPRNFRLMTDRWRRDVEGEAPSRAGLDTLYASASAQPTRVELRNLFAALKKAAPKDSPLYLVDLRQESHGFADNFAVSFYRERNWGNLFLNAKKVEKTEKKQLKKIAGKTETFVPLGNEDKKLFSPKKTKVGAVLTERKAAEDDGFRYLRIAATDQVFPAPEAVDSFIAFYRSMPKNAWLHFHCQAGHGRTTIFMAFFDIMQNPDVDLSDILKRQYLLGGSNFADGRNLENTNVDSSDWRATARIDIAKKLAKFYEYARENRKNGYSVTWSAWLREHGDDGRAAAEKFWQTQLAKNK